MNNAAALGIPLLFTFQNKQYEVLRLKQKILGKYETIRAEKARDRLRSRKKEYSRKEYLVEMRLIDAAEDEGYYALMNPKSATSVLKPENLRILFGLLIPSATSDLIDLMLEEQLEEMLLLFNRLVQQSFPAAAKKLEAKTLEAKLTAEANLPCQTVEESLQAQISQEQSEDATSATPS